jgi:GT2 family glycosyltransferase
MQSMSLCIVNHDGIGHLRSTLPAVRAVAGCFSEVLLLDNASTDDSCAYFEEQLPEGRVLRLNENRSPGAARSAGFGAVSTDLVLFADNDIILDAGAVTLLTQAVTENPECVIAMPRVVLTRRPDRIQYEGAHCHWLGHMILRNEDAPRSAGGALPVAVDSMISACFLVVKSRWPDRAFFDPGYRFYYEDHDVGVRARLAGLSMLAVPAAVVLHGEGTPELSLRPGGRYAPRRVRTLIEGRWRHLLKNMSARTLIVLAPALLLYECAQFGAVLTKGWLPHWWAACRYTRQSWTELRQERRRVQAMRRTPDRELLRGGPLPFKAELTRGPLARGALGLCNAAFGWYWSLARRLL